MPEVLKSKAEVEAAIRRLMRKPLERHARLILRADRLTAAAVAANALGTRASVASGVCTLFLIRATNDLRCMLNLSRVGYLLQSWAIGTSLIEAAVGVAYVRSDAARARAWLQHADITRSPWSVRRGVDEMATAIGAPERADSLYRQFQQLSVAKHGNPALLKRYGVSRAAAGGSKIQLDPHHSPGTERLLKIGLSAGLRFYSLALGCFWRDHVAEMRSGARVVRFTTDVSHL